MPRNDKPDLDDATSVLNLNEAQSPYKAEVWRQLTPREQLRRLWQMRSRLPDPEAVHDRKLFNTTQAVAVTKPASTIRTTTSKTAIDRFQIVRLASCA
jgi:hypothetical protein